MLEYHTCIPCATDMFELSESSDEEGGEQEEKVESGFFFGGILLFMRLLAMMINNDVVCALKSNKISTSAPINRFSPFLSHS